MADVMNKNKIEYKNSNNSLSIIIRLITKIATMAWVW